MSVAYVGGGGGGGLGHAKIRLAENRRRFPRNDEIFCESFNTDKNVSQQAKQVSLGILFNQERIKICKTGNVRIV